MSSTSEHPSPVGGEALGPDERDARAFTPRSSKKSCFFCSIVGGEAKAFEVLRTEHFFAFLDIMPVFLGHTLLVPVNHLQTFDQLPADLSVEWVTTSQRLQLAVEHVTRSDGSLLIINNVVSQSVPHLHHHIIPRRKEDGLRLWLGPRTSYASEAEAENMAERIRAELAK